MSSTLHEILWKNKAEDLPSSSAQRQDDEDIQLKPKQAEEEDATQRRGVLLAKTLFASVISFLTVQVKDYVNDCSKELVLCRCPPGNSASHLTTHVTDSYQTPGLKVAGIQCFLYSQTSDAYFL